MLDNPTAHAVGMGTASLEALVGHLGAGSIDVARRKEALARFEELPARATIRSSRSWKRELATIDLAALAPFDDGRGAELDVEALLPRAREAGVTIERFSLARERHRDAFERAFGVAVDTRDDKFASLALAFQNHGAFVDVPAGVNVDETIVLGYEARAAGLFPYTLVSLGAGARASVLERIRGIADAPLVCGITEFVLADRAHLRYAVDQRTASATTVVMTRRARLGADAHLEIGLAELGAGYSVSKLRTVKAAAGAHVDIGALFFSDEDQHIDIEMETVHAAPATESRTIVRSAGIGAGQGRFLGNIKILPDAHGADASLRDDALLLSDRAHIDSVPALEISANDVKAFHGATIGAISDEELFYAESRGIARRDAERMIALGFFEPAIACFPGEALREELRLALQAKIGTGERS